MTDFWKGKHVAVTGAAGFVGAHLVRMLLEAGADVLVLDNFSRGETRVEGARYDTASAAEPIACRRAFKGREVVFNLAAHVAGVIYNQQHQLEMYAHNHALQVVPVEVAAELRIPHFLQVSSVCVYGEQYTSPCKEENGWLGEPTAANSGYAHAKRMGERAALWANLPHLVIVRPSNIYGSGDYFDERAHVIPALIRKCLEDNVIVVNGTGEEVREFLYVEDAARGMMHAIEHGDSDAIYNVGTSATAKISQLVDLIQMFTNTDSKSVSYRANWFDVGDKVRWSDTTRIRGLGYLPKWTMQDGIAETIEDYLARYCVDQRPVSASAAPVLAPVL